MVELFGGINKDDELYVIGKFDVHGKLVELCGAGRPKTIRVYEGINEVRNGLKYMSRHTHLIVKPIRISEGDVIKL